MSCVRYVNCVIVMEYHCQMSCVRYVNCVTVLLNITVRYPVSHEWQCYCMSLSNVLCQMSDSVTVCHCQPVRCVTDTVTGLLYVCVRCVTWLLYVTVRCTVSDMWNVWLYYWISLSDVLCQICEMCACVIEYHCQMSCVRYVNCVTVMEYHCQMSCVRYVNCVTVLLNITVRYPVSDEWQCYCMSLSNVLCQMSDSVTVCHCQPVRCVTDTVTGLLDVCVRCVTWLLCVTLRYPVSDEWQCYCMSLSNVLCQMSDSVTVCHCQPVRCVNDTVTGLLYVCVRCVTWLLCVTVRHPVSDVWNVCSITDNHLLIIPRHCVWPGLGRGIRKLRSSST